MAVSTNTYEIPGILTLATVTKTLQLAFAELAKGTEVFNFVAVTELDSAALAFIFACRREAERRGIGFRCSNLPDNLKNLAGLYGVEAYLPIEET